MTDERDYHAAPGVNWSQLKHLRESPLHYAHARDQGVKDTRALALGRFTHALVFEPDTVERDYAIWEGGRRQGTDWEAFRAAHEGKTILRAEDIDAAVAMANAVKLHPLVQPYLDDGAFERPLFWADAATGLACKARPDWLIPARKCLIDLKTCRRAEAWRFGRDAARHGYHCQMAHYAAGIAAALDWHPVETLLIAVESAPPHDVAVFALDDDVLWAGAETVRELLVQLKACQIANQWPGRYSEPQALRLPAWVFETEEDETFGLQIEDESWT